MALATTTIAQSASAVVSEGCANYAPIEQCLGHDAIMTIKRFLDGIREMEQMKSNDIGRKDWRGDIPHTDNLLLVNSMLQQPIAGEEYRNCAKDRLCMLLETAKCEQIRMVEYEPHTNRYCDIGALLKSLGYEYKPGQKFASDSRKDISDPHPAILELASLFNIVGLDIADIAFRNDKGAGFRDIQRYIMASY